MTGPGNGSQGPDALERCPICLGVLPGTDLATPDSCNHRFCLGCLLTWAQSPWRVFLSVRLDPALSRLQVPLRKRLGQTEPDDCLKTPKGRRVRRGEEEEEAAAADATCKGLIRKCGYARPSSTGTNKVKGGVQCCSWSLLDMSESVWVTEEEEQELPFEVESKQCRRQTEACPWLRPPAPCVAAGGPAPRHSFPSLNWSNGLFPSPFSPTASSGVFQGRVCAVTSTKGGRGGRASGSKAPPKQAAPVAARRSRRSSSKTQEEAPASDPGSPSCSGDSDASSGNPAPAPARRKGKQPPNRKPRRRAKAPAKRKTPARVASEEEEEEEDEEEGGVGDEEVQGGEEEEEEEEGGVMQEAENSDAGGGSDAERPPTEPGSPPLVDADSHLGGGGESLEQPEREDETDGQTDEEEEEEVDDVEEVEKLSLRSDSAPYSPEVHSAGEKEEERCPGSPAPQGQNSDSPSPPDSPSGPAGSPPTPGSMKDNWTDGAVAAHAASPTVKHVAEAEQSGKSAGPGSATAESHRAPDAGDPDAAATSTPPEAPGTCDPGAVVEDATTEDHVNTVPIDCSRPSSPVGAPASDPLIPKSLEGPPEGPPAGIASPSHHSPPAGGASDESDEAPRVEGGGDERRRERSPERKNGRQRRSRFHSPSSTWDRGRESRRDSSRRSRSRERSTGQDASPPSRRSSRPRSRERDARRERSRDRKRRRSKSRSRSRSRSASRSRGRRRGPSAERPPSRERSPPRRDRAGGWRSGGDSRRFQGGGGGRSENGVPPAAASPDRQPFRSSNPDWVTEAVRNEGRDGGGSWERGGSERGRGCSRSFYNQQGAPADGRRNRNNFSGNGSGSDAYSRFNEARGGGRRMDSEQGESMVDRSGWSSASSWAVRRTLPADVQDYYSRRERGGGGSSGGGGGGGGGWRQEEEQPADALFKAEAASQVVPGNAPVPVMSGLLPHPPQLSVPHHHLYPPPLRGAPPVSLQSAAPYAMAPPPQVPVHLHPAVPLLQMPAAVGGAQGLPPPPPPPPPLQQGGHAMATAAQPDAHMAQMPGAMLAYGKPPPPAPQTKASWAPSLQSQALPSSTTQHGHSSKKEKKQQIQERAVNEVKSAIKPFYQRKEISKDEYKEIVRKAVEKVCHSKSGEVNSSKVSNMIKAYVDKYKHARRK